MLISLIVRELTKGGPLTPPVVHLFENAHIFQHKDYIYLSLFTQKKTTYKKFYTKLYNLFIFTICLHIDSPYRGLLLKKNNFKLIFLPYYLEPTILTFLWKVFFQPHNVIHSKLFWYYSDILFLILSLFVSSLLNISYFQSILRSIRTMVWIIISSKIICRSQQIILIVLILGFFIIYSSPNPILFVLFHWTLAASQWLFRTLLLVLLKVPFYFYLVT